MLQEPVNMKSFILWSCYFAWERERERERGGSGEKVLWTFKYKMEWLKWKFFFIRPFLLYFEWIFCVLLLIPFICDIWIILYQMTIYLYYVYILDYNHWISVLNNVIVVLLFYVLSLNFSIFPLLSCIVTHQLPFFFWPVSLCWYVST